MFVFYRHLLDQIILSTLNLIIQLHDWCFIPWRKKKKNLQLTSYDLSLSLWSSPHRMSLVIYIPIASPLIYSHIWLTIVTIKSSTNIISPRRKLVYLYTTSASRPLIHLYTPRSGSYCTRVCRLRCGQSKPSVCWFGRVSVLCGLLIARESDQWAK